MKEMWMFQVFDGLHPLGNFHFIITEEGLVKKAKELKEKRQQCWPFWILCYPCVIEDDEMTYNSDMSLYPIHIRFENEGMEEPTVKRGEFYK